MSSLEYQRSRKRKGSIAVDTEKRSAESIKEIYLAGGCFWGVEKYLSLIKGVVSTEVGYANGSTENL